jgi:ATP-binding cassette subfamily C protein
VAAAFVMSFIYNALRLTGPLFMLLIYDRVLPSRSVETLVALFIMVAVFVLTMGLIDYSRRRVLARFGAQFQERIEERLFTATSRNEFFVRAQAKPTAGLDQLDGLRAFFHSGALVSILDFFWMPMFLAIIFVLHWILGWLTVGGIAFLALLIAARMLSSSAREERAKTASKKIGILKDLMVSSRDVIRGQEMGAAVKERWLAARKASRDRAIELRDRTLWFDVYIRQFRLLLQYSVMATGAYFTLMGELTVGAMVAAMFLVSRVFSTVEDFLGDFPTIWKSWGQWKSLKRILAAKEAVHANPYNDTEADLRAKLELANVSVRSPLTGQQILRSLNLRIGSGRMVEIIGESRAGKTVMAETILGGWKTSGGTILFGGVNVERLSDRETAKTFGYVPETVTFVAGTIEENIARLEVAPDRDRVVAAAKMAQIHQIIMALPEGYHTQIDAAGSGFSRGERHRLAFARAVYNEPELLIIDEPDQLLREDLLKSLRPALAEFKNRGAVVIVFAREKLSHPMSSGQLLLDRGRLKQFKVPDNVTKLSEKKPVKKVSSIAGE